MKLFAYSGELIAFVDVKWIILRTIFFGILVGGMIFWGYISLIQSPQTIFRSNSANILETENIILHQELNLLSIRINSAEIQTNELHLFSNNLDKLLFRSVIVGDTSLSSKKEVSMFKMQSTLLAKQSITP